MTKIFALLVMLTAGVGPAVEPEYVPAGERAYTIDLERDGFVNGKMDSDRMMIVRNCKLERDAAYLYSLMLEAADEDGITLRPIDCYRTYQEQDRAYNRACPIKEVPASAAPGATGVKKVRICSGPPVAPPGRSNHGWGRAVDFKDRYHTLTCYDTEYDWLRANAHRFGWVNPPWAACGLDTQEPWHWEFAGVTDPTLVEYIVVDYTLLPPLE